MPEPFYVGYLPCPPETARFGRRVAVLLVLAIGVVTATLGVAHHRYAPSRFEYGLVRGFEGTIRARPYPLLEVERPGADAAMRSTSAYPIVAPGKHGADALVDGLDGKRTRLRGTLVYRSGRTMVEVEPGSIATIGAGAPPAASVDLGEMELRGEIVDSKCWLGVMNPGELRVHRACAIRCISGGIPPVLAVKDARGRAEYFFLVAPDGSPVGDRVLDVVGIPVAIRGRVERRGDLLFLKADPGTFIVLF